MKFLLTWNFLLMHYTNLAYQLSVVPFIYWYRDEVLEAFQKSRQELRLKMLEDEIALLKDKEKVDLLFDKKNK